MRGDAGHSANMHILSSHKGWPPSGIFPPSCLALVTSLVFLPVEIEGKAHKLCSTQWLAKKE